MYNYDLVLDCKIRLGAWYIILLSHLHPTHLFFIRIWSAYSGRLSFWTTLFILFASLYQSKSRTFMFLWYREMRIASISKTWLIGYFELTVFGLPFPSLQFCSILCILIFMSGYCIFPCHVLSSKPSCLILWHANWCGLKNLSNPFSL